MYYENIGLSFYRKCFVTPKMHQIRFRPGLEPPPGPAGGALITALREIAGGEGVAAR